MVVCLEPGADLHMAQLMPLPLTVSCFSKIQTGFTFLVPAHPVVPEKRSLNGCVCVCDTVDMKDIKPSCWPVHWHAVKAALFLHKMSAFGFIVRVCALEVTVLK